MLMDYGIIKIASFAEAFFHDMLSKIDRESEQDVSYMDPNILLRLDLICHENE